MLYLHIPAAVPHSNDVHFDVWFVHTVYSVCTSHFVKLGLLDACLQINIYRTLLFILVNLIF